MTLRNLSRICRNLKLLPSGCFPAAAAWLAFAAILPARADTAPGEEGRTRTFTLAEKTIRRAKENLPKHLPALAADPAAITHIDQRPWILNAGGVLKSETELTIENHRGQAVDAWVKIRVPGQPDCVESLGSLPPGTNVLAVYANVEYDQKTK